MVQLTDNQRKLIHDLALEARELLTREAQELLEGTYGLYPDGRLEPPEKLPQVQADPETAETYRRLVQFLDDEEHAGLPRAEAVAKLVKEVAFTHLNRLVAFKMMEVRKLIRGTVDKGMESNGFKFYLADPEQADEYALYQAGRAETAYRHFLLWQSAQIAAEVRVLFDPDTLASRLFPRPRALDKLLAMLNRPELVDIWHADETVGWVYQYFNEPELQAAFEKVRTSGAKFEARDIPSASQLFTPHWIVRFLVQNTLGRLWVRMHPDTRLAGTELLDYLVPLQGEELAEPLRSVREITLLDPACGTMHFGLVAFDLFAAMYREEFDRAAEPGWPQIPSVEDPAEIPMAIIAHNLHGIDLDLRAVQLSALALYLKAKALNPKARITDSNLACADVLPLNGARLGTFLREAHFSRPVYERLIRALWNRLQDVNQLGSLLRLEQELGEMIAEERARYEKMPLFAGVSGEFEQDAGEEEFWNAIQSQIVMGLDEFARQQAQTGVDQTFFSEEAVKGLRLLDLMLRRYDVVVTNPPYMTRGKMNPELANLVADAYPEGKNDLFAAFIQRCLEFAEDRGYVGMLTMHAFMFLGSYEALRQDIRRQAAIETMAHCGPGLFDVGNPGTLQTTAFALRKEPETLRRECTIGSYYRLVHVSTGDAKRQVFEQALTEENLAHSVQQQRFDAIPDAIWAYWLSTDVNDLFSSLPSLGAVAQPRQGLVTADNFRYIRFWWEVGVERVQYGCESREDALNTGGHWFPAVKSGQAKRWYASTIEVVNWHKDGKEIMNFFRPSGRLASRPQNMTYYFLPGVAYSAVTSGDLSFRWLPPGYIFEHASNAIYPEGTDWSPLALTALFNSSFVHFVVGLSETINVNIADLRRVPIVLAGSTGGLELKAAGCVVLRWVEDAALERYAGFTCPSRWSPSLSHLTIVQNRMTILEAEIDDDVYRLYGISDEDRSAIEAELAGRTMTSYDEDETAPNKAEDAEELEATMTREELAVRWISYAAGVVLGRFKPGVVGELGSAVYRRTDFAVGFLPEPDGAEFDELVGPPERFAYVDAEGGRHVFPAEVEGALRDLAVPDGITVLDEGHPRDLPALAERALVLMLGDQSTHEAITEGAGGDLRRFLERDYFTKWHLRWYRKRPVYWPLQSAKRSYGFVLFHERVDKSTLYVLQRDYLDHKLNGLRLEIGDLRGQLDFLSGAALKRVEWQIDQAAQLLDEVNEFAQTMERIVREGYEPEPNWIDDGVILRLAPLWELIPIWKAEPKKYWGRLQKGQYDWSHIAMGYWPERVREACKANKSFAIAHRHEEWYEGR